MAGVAAIASVLVTVAAVLVAARGSAPRREAGARVDRAEQLLDFHAGVQWQLGGSLLRAVGLLLVLVVVLRLQGIVTARRPGLPRLLLWAGLLGTVTIALTTVTGFLALRDVVDAFVAGGPRTVARAQDLVNGAGWLRATRIIELAGHLFFAIWLAGIALAAMQAELLTGLLGYWGAAAALAQVALPIGDPLFIGWLASVGVLLVGYWPGGRPRGWEAEQERAS